jgi:RNA polymerase-binding transcription factor DksA
MEGTLMCEQCGRVIATTRLTEMPQARYCAAGDR